MKWRKIKIGEAVSKCSNWNPKTEGIDTFSYIDLSSVDKDRKRISDIEGLACSEAPSRARQLVEKNDVLVATVRPNLNGVALVEEIHQGMTASTGYCVLRPDHNILLPEFLFHWVKTDTFIQRMVDVASGANYPAVSDAKIKASKIPLPPLAEQKRLAAILDAADALRAKRQQALAHLDDLLQSTFLTLFGDPVTNPLGWKIDSLANHGSFKNGLNYGKSERGIEIRCLGVGNFKAHSRLSDVTSLPILNLDSMPSNGYLLEEGDIIFVRSNGNRALVGRCLSIHPNGNQVTFSGFCIRYRVEDSKWLPPYLSHLFRTESLRAAMLQGGQGANIQNINQKILSSLPIPLPPLTLQQRFAAIVEKIEAQKARHRAHLAEFDTLFASLQSRAFSGEL